MQRMSESYYASPNSEEYAVPDWCLRQYGGESPCFSTLPALMIDAA